MYYNLNWDITIGRYRLALLDSVEIHKSADLLAATAEIKLPGSVYNKALKIEVDHSASSGQRIKRGDEVVIRLGYENDPKKLKEEFRGYLLNINTDDGSITLNCEDDLFLMRKSVGDKEFVKATIKTIAQYLLDEINAGIKLNISYEETTPIYDKFVIHQATAYDVLKKLKDETKFEIYLNAGELHIHPPMVYKTGDVSYSFQQNIESSDLKYKRAEDKNIEVNIEYTDKNGQKKTESYGRAGGDKITRSVGGMSASGAKEMAKIEYDSQMYDGYEGSITGWLIPFCAVGYSAKIKDEDYQYKDGTYYVKSVTISAGSDGGVRKVELGKRLL